MKEMSNGTLIRTSFMAFISRHLGWRDDVDATIGTWREEEGRLLPLDPGPILGEHLTAAANSIVKGMGFRRNDPRSLSARKGQEGKAPPVRAVKPVQLEFEGMFLLCVRTVVHAVNPAKDFCQGVHTAWCLDHAEEAAIRQISFDDFWQEVTAEAEKQRVG